MNNKLLSGERLSEDAYNGKAEDNMVKLIKDNEKSHRHSICLGFDAPAFTLNYLLIALTSFSHI